MTITHFGTVNVAELPIFVELQDLNCFATDLVLAEATINARTFGDVTCRKNGATVVQYDWIDPKFEAPGSPLYQIRRTNTVEVNVDLDSDPGFGPFEGVWQEVGVLAFWGFQLTGPLGSTASATFDVSIRQGTGPVIDTVSWSLSTTIGSSGGGGGGGGCFVYGTLMRMADGLLKEVQDIVPGDVMAAGGRVYQQQIGDASLETWYDVDGVIVTGTHTMCKDGVWMHIEDAGYPEADCDDQVYYVVSNYNHQMMTENGQLFTDYSEVEYQSSGWDEWVLLKLNGKADNETMRQAIESTQRKT